MFNGLWDWACYDMTGGFTRASTGFGYLVGESIVSPLPFGGPTVCDNSISHSTILLDCGLYIPLCPH